MSLYCILHGSWLIFTASMAIYWFMPYLRRLSLPYCLYFKLQTSVVSYRWTKILVHAARCWLSFLTSWNIVITYHDIPWPMSWPLSSYFGCHYSIMALITLFRLLLTHNTNYRLILAIITLLIGHYQWWSLQTDFMSSIWLRKTIFYYRFACRNLASSFPPFIIEHDFHYRICWT